MIKMMTQKDIAWIDREFNDSIYQPVSIILVDFLSQLDYENFHQVQQQMIADNIYYDEIYIIEK